MTDFIDRAVDREAEITAAAVANRVQYKGTSAKNCSSCGTEIPEARRQAIKGSTQCVDCAGFSEGRRHG